MNLILAATFYHLLAFHLPLYDEGPSPCSTGLLPFGTQAYYVEIEASHDSLTWTHQARWGARGMVAGASYTLAAWPDTAGPKLWYRVSVCDTAGNLACPSNARRIK